MTETTNGFARGGYPPPHPETIEIFWSKVDKTNGPVHPKLGTRCWPWLGQVRKDDGYGKTAFRVGGKRTFLPAHRFAWFVTNGDPAKLWVLHQCDNRVCCNPAHHFLGTTQANTADMMAKGRKPKGPDTGGKLYSKILRVVVLEMRAAHGNPVEIRRLSAKYGIHPTYVRAVGRGALLKWAQPDA